MSNLNITPRTNRDADEWRDSVRGIQQRIYSYQWELPQICWLQVGIQIETLISVVDEWTDNSGNIHPEELSEAVQTAVESGIDRKIAIAIFSKFSG